MFGWMLVVVVCVNVLYFLSMLVFYLNMFWVLRLYLINKEFNLFSCVFNLFILDLIVWFVIDFIFLILVVFKVEYLLDILLYCCFKFWNCLLFKFLLKVGFCEINFDIDLKLVWFCFNNFCKLFNFISNFCLSLMFCFFDCLYCCIKVFIVFVIVIFFSNFVLIFFIFIL